MLKTVLIIIGFQIYFCSTVFGCFYFHYKKVELESAIKTHKPITLNEDTYQCYNNEDFKNNFRPRRTTWKNRSLK